MAKLPREPDLARLRELEPEIIELPAGTELARVYFRGGAHPSQWNEFRYFGPTKSRFDHHELDADGRGYVQARGVIYLATRPSTCLAEVFQEEPPRVIQRSVRDPWLVTFALTRVVSLLNLSNRFPVRCGASMKLVSGPHSYGRAWARGLYDVYSMIEGLYFPSSLTNEPVVALNERADTGDVFPEAPVFHRALADPAMSSPLRAVAAEIGFRLL